MLQASPIINAQSENNVTSLWNHLRSMGTLKILQNTYLSTKEQVNSQIVAFNINVK